MKDKLICALAVALLPVTVQAQAYKCKQADGSVSFQSQPCPANSTSSVVSTTPANGSVAKPAARQAAGVVPVRRATAANPYPYGTADDVARLKTENAELQDMVAKAKAADPNWRQSESKTRVIEQAETLNKRIQADTQPRR